MSATKPASHFRPPVERTEELSTLKLASFGARALALVIDFALAGALFMGTMLGLIAITKYVPAIRDWDANKHIDIELNFFHNWYSVIYLVIFFGLSLYWGQGRTIGKRIMRIRVVSLYHKHLSLWHCVERALAYGASALELGFGFVQYFMHPNRQTVHDRIAETIVVEDPRPSRRDPR
jgi:uncharacterized RDD family membrane protein YckC